MGLYKIKVICKVKLSDFYKEKSGNLFIQIIRYITAGGIAFVVDFALLYLLTDFFDFHYLTSSRISFSVGLIITYLFSIFWIFDKRRIDNRKVEFLIFVVIGIIGFVLTDLFMKFFTDFLSVHYLLSKILTTIIVFVWNFVAKRFILFTEKNQEPRAKSQDGLQRFWAFYIPYFIFIIVLAILLLTNEKAELHLLLAGKHTAFGDVFFNYVTEFGSSFPFIVAGLLLFYKYRATLFIMVSGMFAAIITHSIKWICNMPRPKIFFAENFPDIVLTMVEGVRVHSWQSFPSGHTTAAFSFFLCLAFMTKNKALQFFYCSAAILAGYSRIYLQQHFASDVLAGAIIGGLSTTLCYIFIFNKYKMTWANGSL